MTNISADKTNRMLFSTEEEIFNKCFAEALVYNLKKAVHILPRLATVET